jgi:two-component system response regulator ChvI
MVSETGWPRAAMAQARSARVVIVEGGGQPGAGLGMEFAERLQADGAVLLNCAPGPDLPARLARMEGDLVLLPAEARGADPVALLRDLGGGAGPPVAVVTRRPDDTAEMRCLAAGADAYLDLREPPWKLCLRLQALRRRGPPGGPDSDGRLLRQGPLRIDLDRREVYWRDTPVEVSAAELSLLVSLARRPGHVRTRAQLMDAVHGDSLEVADRTIDSHVKRLRKKLRALDPQFSAIRTLYGVGYSFSA